MTDLSKEELQIKIDELVARISGLGQELQWDFFEEREKWRNSGSSLSLREWMGCVGKEGWIPVLLENVKKVKS